MTLSAELLRYDSLRVLSPPSPPMLQVVDSRVTSLRNQSVTKEHGEKPDWGNGFQDTKSPQAEACSHPSPHPPASSWSPYMSECGTLKGMA